jgi:hypothetical protein
MAWLRRIRAWWRGKVDPDELDLAKSVDDDHETARGDHYGGSHMSGDRRRDS